MFVVLFIYVVCSLNVTVDDILLDVVLLDVIPLVCLVLNTSYIYKKELPCSI